ncbi:MAG TPA: hypothetical protein VG297_08200 [Bryobacteraceae bacterium]|nr:hypothetical protein [Bryobacteraceae bacterium]
MKAAPAPRRRAKPAFDIPDVAGEPGAPAAWVYREDPPAAATQTAGAPPQSNRLLSTGMGLLFAGAAPVAFVSLLAIGFVTAPFVLAKSAFTS